MSSGRKRHQNTKDITSKIKVNKTASKSLNNESKQKGKRESRSTKTVEIESEQKEKARIKPKRTENNQSSATFIESQDLVEMETEGMSTDFMEDDEQDQGMESSQNRNTETESEPSDLEEQVDTEVIIGKNNNASVGGRAVKRLGNTCQIEGSVAAQVMEMNKSMNVFKEYVDNKFANLAKLSEVEREIAEKQRVLEELKARGEQSNIIQPREFNEDAMSEMTIYRDAV